MLALGRRGEAPEMNEIVSRCTTRDMLLVVGKASALSVLMMSLSDHMSLIAGIPYIEPSSFALCAAIAFLLLLLIRPLVRQSVRIGCSIATLVLMLIWCGLVVALRGIGALGSEVPDAILLGYATVGRITTLLINAQWNVHMSLSRVFESARLAATSLMLAMLFFICSYFLEGFLALFLLIAAALASCILNIIMEVSVSSNDDSGYSFNNVRKIDALEPVPDDAAKRTRILFFGSRILYGIFLGMVVGAALHAQPVYVSEEPIALFCVAALSLGIVGSCFFFGDSRAASYVIAVLPIGLVLLASTCFFSQEIERMARVFVVMTEVVWIAQNLLQLPSYRKMTKLDPTSFAFVEYAFQIIPFYLAAWMCTSHTGIFPAILATGVPLAVFEMFGLGCLVIVASIAIIRHIVRYHPIPHDSEGCLNTEASISDIKTMASMADKYGLTSREQEVCTFLAMGYSRPYIAKMLYIAPDTAKTHTKHIYTKMGVDSQDSLIALVRDGGKQER